MEFLAAFERLSAALGAHETDKLLASRSRKTVINDLRAALGSRAELQATVGHGDVRYSPMTETYRSAVDLSLLNPHASATRGHLGRGNQAFGVLLDMAEIWELYIAKLLQIGVLGVHVSHTGRTSHHFHWLLSSANGTDTFGSLRPDILIPDHRNRCLAIADARSDDTH